MICSRSVDDLVVMSLPVCTEACALEQMSCSGWLSSLCMPGHGVCSKSELVMLLCKVPKHLLGVTRQYCAHVPSLLLTTCRVARDPTPLDPPCGLR